LDAWNPHAVRRQDPVRIEPQEGTSSAHDQENGEHDARALTTRTARGNSPRWRRENKLNQAAQPGTGCFEAPVPMKYLTVTTTCMRAMNAGPARTAAQTKLSPNKTREATAKLIALGVKKN